MKFSVAIVITLVSLVQISQSHTIPPTIIEKSFETSDDVSQVNQIDNTTPEVAQLDLDNPEPPKISEPPSLVDSTDNGTESSKNDELIFAQVMYRHGEIDIPNNIEITNEGKKNLYELGLYFHRRYGKLLGEGYHQDKIYILSTEHDRAIMSAQANLAGLFEPTSAEKWSDKIKWSPVPVHTLPTVLDNILRPRYDGRCPKYDEMYDWYIKKSKEAKEMYKKYGKLFKDWEKNSGQKIKHIEHVFSIYKKFLGEKKQGKPIPEWAEEACRPGGPMEEIGKVVYLLRAKPRLVRIRSGFLLKEMLERFDTKEKGKLKPDRVLWMYSAHSSTITTLLNGLRFNMSIPSNGFSFQFEMFKTPKDEHYLQLFLRKPDVEKPEPVEIPGCGKKCTVKEFSKVYEELIPDEFEKECGVKKPHEPENPDKPDKPDKPEKPDKPDKPNAAAISENGRVFSIVLGTLWFIHKFHYF